jgi:NhaP-type Na+/H+ or K+/H+ antiporter
MNTVALRFLAIVLAIAVLTFIFAWFSKKELVQRVKETIAWLLKVSFFDFVQLIIFIKPLKKYSSPIGVIVWLILVFVVGRYLIVTQPEITEIPGPYIPMIGYVYYLSALFIIRFVLGISKRID